MSTDRTRRRDEVAAAFDRRFGGAPDGVWSAPGRVNLIGEHTDYNDGFVLPFAIDRRAFAALRLRDDRMLRVASTATESVVEIPAPDLSPAAAAWDRSTGWARYPLGVAWALGGNSARGRGTPFAAAAADLAAVPGVDLLIDSDVPVGAGLSSSAAIESAVAVALNDAWRLGLTTADLVTAGHIAENDFVGAPTGILDQSASLFGAADAAVFIDCRSRATEVVPLGLAEAGLTVLVADTGVAHAHADGGYAERRASCEAGAAALGVTALRDVTSDDLPRAREVLDEVTFRRVRHIVTEDARVLETVRLLRTAGPSAIGDLLDASHRSMRDDFEISVPELDLAIEIAQNYGAIGARMTGGGFGGSAIALVPTALVTQVEVALDGAFAEHGYAQPEMFTVTPDAGALREG